MRWPSCEKRLSEGIDMNMGKKAGKIFSGISFGLSLLLLLSAIFLSNVPAHESYTYENGVIVVHSWQNCFRIATELILYFVLSAVVASTVICVVSKIRWKEKIAKTMLCSWLVGLVCLYMISFSDSAVFGLFGNDFDPEWYEFSDGQRTIVIEEESFLLGGWGTIYPIKENGTAVVIGSFSTDDGLRNKGTYEIKWFEDGAEITYLFDPGGPRTETVYFEP